METGQDFIPQVITQKSEEQQSWSLSCLIWTPVFHVSLRVTSQAFQGQEMIPPHNLFRQSQASNEIRRKGS